MISVQPTVAALLIAGGASLILYSYLGYPLLLKVWGDRRSRSGANAPGSGGNGPLARRYSRRRGAAPAHHLPLVSITVPVYNEEAQIRGLLESLLALDYPRERRQILIVSDASTDRTDEIVSEYADRGVELLRIPRRSGKTAAENAARYRLRGEIVINTDASVRMDPMAVRHLVSRFADPMVGVASARDISVTRAEGDRNAGESGYVGYEMWVRGLEDRVHGIIGASGCCYAIRASLHRLALPESLSRDFAAALHAREHGYRTTTVPEALCYVPRAGSLQVEYRRKVRTMIRGMQTLFYKRHLLNPVRYGVFAWMLFSHKVCRWLVPWALAGTAAGIVLLATSYPAARLALAGLAGLGILAAGGWYWPEGRRPPGAVAIPAYLVLGNLAALHAAVLALRGVRNPVWEPTRRDPVRVATAVTTHPGGR